jgi:hypothetical protein
MKRRHAALSIVILGLLVVGCGQGDTTKAKAPAQSPAASKATGGEAKADAAAQAAKVKLVTLDLSPAGLPLTIEAPEGATAENPFKIEVQVKKKDTPFELVISEKEFDMVKQKASYEKDKPTYLIDEPNFLFVETKAFGSPAYFLDATFKIGGKNYHVRDGRSPANREQAELMVRSAKTLAAKK